MASKKASQEVAVKENTAIMEQPDYLKGDEKTGTERLGRGDFKIPRIKLLQPLSPEVKSFPGKAIPGEFWHTGANKSIGNEFLFVPCVVSKRVILWRPQNDGDGGILAFSKNAVDWVSGGNKEFEVQIKDGPKVKWKTGKNVPSSGLLEFGTSNPNNENSAPAANLAYEYMAFLIDHPDLSPVVLGVQRTGIGNAKQLNSHLLMTRRPTACVAVRCFSDEETKGRLAWHVPNFEPSGYVREDIYKITSKIADQYSDFDVELEREDTIETTVDDKVEY
jgi:hypothetical protein